MGKKKLISNVDNVVPYTVLYNGTNVLRKGLSSLSVIKKVPLINEEAKGYAHRYFKTMKECINSAFYT